jgi:prepilin-type N-terminal cleavage/methylation domain-containing protein
VSDQRGFTLLEVLVAVGILSLSLTSLLQSQAASLLAIRYSQEVTAAALLAEYQLVEIEYLVLRDGWSQEDRSFEGTFAEQGRPDMSYECLVDVVELPEFSEIIQAKENAEDAAGVSGFGVGGSGVAGTGEQAFGAIGLAWPLVKGAIEQSIRKASCVVRWKDGKIAHDVALETYWTDPTRMQAVPELGGEAEDADEANKTDGSETAPAGGAAGGGGARPSRGLGGPVTVPGGRGG